MCYDNEIAAKKNNNKITMIMQSCSASGEYPRKGVPNVQLVRRSTSSTYVVRRAVVAYAATKPAATLKVKVHSWRSQLFFS